VNASLNKSFQTDDDYVIASDTDSIYVKLDRISAKYNNPDVQKTITVLDKFCDQVLQKVISDTFVEIAEYMNTSTPCLVMKRESIADKGVWTAKKHYLLNVYDNEGVRYAAPKLKVMGIESVKSSTPAVCRETITEVLKLFMNGTQEDVWRYVKEARERFMVAKFEDIASPRSVNGLEKYADSEKGVPIHVRGALCFNRMLEKTGLEKDYEKIHEGEKIRFCYLKESNPFFSHVLSCTDGAPPEWQVEKFIDYQKQFDKSLIEPLEAILGAAGWSAIHKPGLFD
jgi:DNA polymerase elongation subunit (family B)